VAQANVRFSQVQVGDRLPPFTLPVTPSLIVAGAMGSGDFEPVHHDVPGARARGTPDIFMNILTTNGYVQRFVNDWAGPAARIRSVSIRLGVPSYAGDTLRLSGVVREKLSAGAESQLEIAVTGTNSLGEHVAATVRVVLP
jgi:acyl dehydratase